MNDNSEKAIPKLVDFGLSKIIGPTEKADEPFGTLGYVAPEVLQKKPYTFSCDTWSLGCIIYALISGSLPFDHEDNKQVAKMTINNPLVFDLPVWNKTSNQAKDLITGLLEKDHNKRTSLENVFKHEWFKGMAQKFE